MITEIEKTIAVLKERVELNNRIISQNSQLLRNVVAQPLSDLRTELFTKHFRRNLELYSSNYLFIKLQFELHRAKNKSTELKTFGMMSLS